MKKSKEITTTKTPTKIERQKTVQELSEEFDRMWNSLPDSGSLSVGVPHD